MSKDCWVDPPSGWRYGFPKKWNKERDGDMHQWLVDEGYPQSMIDRLGAAFFVRCWYDSDQIENETK